MAFTTKKSTSVTGFSRFLSKWHSFLSLKKQEPSWYAARLQEELFEHAATQPRTIARLSEKSDILYIISRAEHDGYPFASPKRSLSPPGIKIFGPRRNAHEYGYMIGKYTGRWVFWKTAAGISRKLDMNSNNSKRWDRVNEVINPNRENKIREVANRHEGLNEKRFIRVCNTLRRIFWILP